MRMICHATELARMAVSFFSSRRTQMPITLSQLARELGVSTMTVSRALRGVGRIGEETRTRILTAARDHGYRPHALARAMRSGRTGCVALLLGHATGQARMPDGLVGGIDEALASRGLYLAVSRIGESAALDGGESAPRLLAESVADGALIHYTGAEPPELVERLGRHRVPAVWINGDRPHDCVRADDYDAARRATQRLIQLGHRRIAFANHLQSRNDEVPQHRSFEQRYRGYASILSEAGLPHRRVYRHPLVSFVEMWRAILAEPANQRPTAVICHSRYTAHPLLQAAGQMQRDIPKDLSLVSIDDEPATEFEFPLSTLVVPQRQIGGKAVEMLCARIDNPAEPQPAVKLLAEWFDGGTMAAPSRSAV
jgi:LacI family transcriptional regulator